MNLKPTPPRPETPTQVQPRHTVQPPYHWPSSRPKLWEIDTVGIPKPHPEPRREPVPDPGAVRRARFREMCWTVSAGCWLILSAGATGAAIAWVWKAVL